jgi:chromosome partitioning protein
MSDPQQQLSDDEAALRDRIEALRAGNDGRAGTVVTVAASKGGVGKTTLAIELAWSLGATLVDLDWDAGGASKALGYRWESYVVRAPLLDALASGKTPRIWSLSNRPELIPSHPDFEANQPDPEEMADSLTRWAKELGTCLVVDTHPGSGSAAAGAIGAADVVVVPTVLATRELDALEGQLAELHGYPLLLVPSMVPTIPLSANVQRLEKIANRYNVPVAPPISEYGWYPNRRVRTAITALPRPSARAARFAEEVAAVAEEVARNVNTQN